MQLCKTVNQRQDGKAYSFVRISVSDVQMCKGNPQRSSTGVTALMTYVTDIKQLLPHKATVSAFNKAAKFGHLVLRVTF